MKNQKAKQNNNNKEETAERFRLLDSASLLSVLESQILTLDKLHL